MMKTAITLLCVLLTFWNGAAFATVESGIEWDVRTTGSDTNAGGFAGSRTTCTGGTDWSVQDAAHVTFDGATITATTSGISTTILITGYTVLAGDKCNLIVITAGTNFTAGIYEINSVSTGANTWTLDRNATSGVGAGMVAKMGGGFATVNKAMTTWGPIHDAIGLKSGTYTFTSAVVPSTINSQTGIDNTFIGYGTTHGDGGTAPLITTATNSTKLFTFSNVVGGLYISNISFSNTAATRSYGLFSNNNGNNTVVIENCTFDGFSTAIEGDWNVGASFQGLIIANSVIKNSTLDGAINSRGGTTIIGSRFTANGGVGFRNDPNPGQNTSVQILYSLFDHNTSSGVQCQASSGNGQYCVSDHSIYSDNGVNGLVFAVGSSAIALSLTNNIFYGNTTYGVSGDANILSFFFSRSNAFGANGNSPRNNISAGSGDVTLTADPFVSRGSNNFALNSTTGGGALLKAVGFPGVLLSGGTGATDIGALQSSGAAGAASSVGIVQ